MFVAKYNVSDENIKWDTIATPNGSAPPAIIII
jgi:hypothetical protein